MFSYPVFREGLTRRLPLLGVEPDSSRPDIMTAGTLVLI
jgi:hypothetical protein